MKKRNLYAFCYTKVFYSVLLLTISLSIKGQFISSGIASLNRINPISRIQPISLLPDGNSPTSGYGVANINPHYLFAGYGHIGVVKGDLTTGVTWDKLYLAENTIEAVKSLIYEKELYVLFNVLTNTNDIAYSGILKIDESTGNVTNVQCFGKADDYVFKAKDFTVCDGKLIVVGEKYFSLWANDYAAQIVVIEPSFLSILGSTAVLYNNEGYLSPTQVVAIKDQFIVSFMAREGFISFNDQVVVAKFGFDINTNNFIQYAEAAYVCPKILSHVNLAYNSYNNTLPLLFQEFANVEGAGTLNLFILDPGTLNPINTNSYRFPRRMYKSNIHINSKFISISAANNTPDNPGNPFGSAQSLFDHNGSFVETVTNPYQRAAGITIGWDFQRNYFDGLTYLFTIENDGFLNWIYGYGTSKECNLKEDKLEAFDNNILRSKGVILKYNDYETSEFKIEEAEAGFYAKVECGKKRFGKQSSATGISENSDKTPCKIIRENGTVTLLSESLIGEYQVMDGFGKVIKSGTAYNNKLTFDATELKEGIYVLRFEIEKQWFTKKILI